MGQNESILVTREQMVAALTEWERLAAEGNWPHRIDPEASADFLLQLLVEQRT